MPRFLQSLLLLLPLFFTTSCIEGEEEIWINLDKSGHLAARYEFPSIAMGQLGDPEKITRALEKVAAREEGLTITRCSHETKNNKVIFRLEAEFDDILELLEIASRNAEAFVRESETDPDKIGAVAGDINFRFQGLRGAFDRVIAPSEIFPEVVAKRPGMLGSSTFQYTLHLPVRVKTTNAHSISPDGKTVTWEFLLRNYFEKPMAMSLVTEVPFPWWAWVLAGMVTLLLLFFVGRFFLRRFILRVTNRRAAQNVDLPAS